MKPHPQHSNLLLFDLFGREDKVVHFTTTRAGGVSSGAFSSFNMGNFSDDDPLKIRENRLILSRMFYTELENFITPHQTHGTNVLTVDKAFLEQDNAAAIEALYGVDATITQEKGVFLCATTADCVPLILFDKKNEVIAAIHAGWRGTVGRIVEKTIAGMQRQYDSSPVDMLVGIGPAICPDHYEVGEEVAEQFQMNGFDLSDAVVSYRDNSISRLHLDLSEINRRELLRLGVPPSSIEKSDLCTFEKQELFFSARRQSVHSGRMLTGIMLEK
jgi:YfiH family protein